MKREIIVDVLFTVAPVVEMSWGSLGGIVASVVWNLLPQRYTSRLHLDKKPL